MVDKQAPLATDVPIVDVAGHPTLEFMRKWQTQVTVNSTIADLSTSSAVSGVLDVLGSSVGSLLLRSTSQWALLASPGDATRFLSGSNPPAYAQVRDSDLAFSDNTAGDVSALAHGFVPKAPADAAQYLDGSGAWSAPPSGGDMLKATYDTNNDGVVNAADTAAALTGSQAADIVANNAKVSDINHVAVLLPNVDNTSDVNKPVSTAQQAALDAKEPSLGNPATDGDVLASTVAGVRSWVTPSSGGGSTTFTGLTDTPAALGTAGQVVAVNAGATALEFVSAGSGGGSTTFTGLTDTPASLGASGQIAYVNNAGTALEFASPIAGGGGGRGINFEDGTIPSDFVFDASGASVVAMADTGTGTTQAMRFRTITDGQTTYFTLTQTYANTTLFILHSKVSSEAGYDFFNVYLDGVREIHVSGTPTLFSTDNMIIPAGSHVLKFEYAKDPSTSAGDDTAYIGSMAFAPTSGQFIGLTDTPADYTGAAGKAVMVNAGGTGLEFATPSGGGAVTYNPFQKLHDIPLSSVFPTVKSIAGSSGSITDDSVNGLTVSSTSGTEAGRLIYTKSLASGWDALTFGMVADQSAVAYGSDGLVMMGAAGTFMTIGVGSSGSSTPWVRILKWNSDGTYNSYVLSGVAWYGWEAFFHIVHRGTAVVVYYSYDGVAWIYGATFDEVTELGAAALYAGPSANQSTTAYMTYYADDDVIPQFTGFV